MNRLKNTMWDKRPIKAFYVPKRSASRTSSHSTQVQQPYPSFTVIDEIGPHDSVRYSPLRRSPRLSDFSTTNSNARLTSNVNNLLTNQENENNPKTSSIIIALIFALLLFGTVIILIVMLVKKYKVRKRISY